MGFQMPKYFTGVFDEGTEEEELPQGGHRVACSQITIILMHARNGTAFGPL